MDAALTIMKHVFLLCAAIASNACGSVEEYHIKLNQVTVPNTCDIIYDLDNLDITWDDRQQLVERCIAGEQIRLTEEMTIED